MIGLLLVFVALTKKPLANMSSPSPVTEVPSLASMAETDDRPSELPRCAGEHCFYPMRFLF